MLAVLGCTTVPVIVFLQQALCFSRKYGVLSPQHLPSTPGAVLPKALAALLPPYLPDNEAVLLNRGWKTLQLPVWEENGGEEAGLAAGAG